MSIVSLLYAALGHLTLLGAILWGMLFFGGSVVFPNMDAGGNVAPLRAACVDLGLLLLLALLHRFVSRGMLRRVAPWSLPSGLERSTRAWAAAGVLLLIYAGWQPLPQALWSAGGPLRWALSALFEDTLRQPLYIGILIAVWVTPVMTVGHLVLAGTVTGYLVFDGLWAARKSDAARESRGTFLLQGERIAR
jgi:methanethiol S-methyltransferase